MQHMIVSVHLGLIRLAFIFKIYIQRFIANRQVCKTLTETTAIKTQHYSFCQGKGKVRIRQLPITTRSLILFFSHFQFNSSTLIFLLSSLSVHFWFTNIYVQNIHIERRFLSPQMVPLYHRSSTNVYKTSCKNSFFLSQKYHQNYKFCF